MTIKSKKIHNYKTNIILYSLLSSPESKNLLITYHNINQYFVVYFVVIVHNFVVREILIYQSKISSKVHTLIN